MGCSRNARFIVVQFIKLEIIREWMTLKICTYRLLIFIDYLMSDKNILQLGSNEDSRNAFVVS